MTKAEPPSGTANTRGTVSERAVELAHERRVPWGWLEMPEQISSGPNTPRPATKTRSPMTQTDDSRSEQRKVGPDVSWMTEETATTAARRTLIEPA